MQCPHCGEQILRPSRFCQHCGGKLAQNVKQDQKQAADATPQQKLRSATNRGSADSFPEEVLWHGSYSKLAMIGAWLGAAVLSLVSLALGLFGGITGEIWLPVIAVNALVWAGLAIRYFYLRFSRHYTLSNQRFTHIRGLLWRQTDRIEVIDIDDVSFSQGPVERMLGIGTVQITSSDQSHPALALPGIENAHVVAGLIDDARRQERRRRGLYIESV